LILVPRGLKIRSRLDPRVVGNQVTYFIRFKCIIIRSQDTGLP
jgi:hypothetical protein